MPLTPGAQIGMYEILSLLGKGGMGEVYRAHDRKLGRDVAIKVLPDVFALDSQRMGRFRREAQMLAALNHPNIATIYGLEESGGQQALALELVDGETLADRIARGPIRFEEALKIALQIAEALEAAHEKSIVHRDLKPANVKITPQGTVKVLDFGLAKALEKTENSPALSQSPTLSVEATIAGVILGTAGYMAPEQARGRVVDRRADIWAFGVILFEMLTSRRIFEGETITDTLAKVLERDPDWNLLPSNTPRPVRKLIQNCLKKGVKDRLQAIGDARTQLQEWVMTPAVLLPAEENTRHRWSRKILPWALAPAFLAAGWLLRPAPDSPTPVVSRLEFVLPNGMSLAHNFRHGIALSPDGKRMAFVGRVLNSTEPQKIYIRILDQWDAVPVAGTEEAENPFFSPDGESLGFQKGQQLMKIELSSGKAIPLADDIGPNQLFGASWGSNGMIVFADRLNRGLKQVRESGGIPEDFTTLDQNADEVSHRLPHFLPGNAGVLFTVVRYHTSTPDWKRAQVWVKSAKTGERKLLLENAVDARYAGAGRLIFARQAKLFTVPFDLGTLTVKGDPEPVLDGVTHATEGGSAGVVTGAAQFSLSDSGTFVYAPGSFEPPSLFSVAWVNQEGQISPPLPMEPLSYLVLRLSPRAERIVYDNYYAGSEIWVYDTVRETKDKQSFEGQNAFPIMTPDGSGFAFRSDHSGPFAVYFKQFNSPEVIQLTTGPGDLPGAWMPDSKTLAFKRDGDYYLVSRDEPNQIRPLIETKSAEEYLEFSPNGEWLAYCSDESGRNELYIQPYPGPGPRVPISSGGADEIGWSSDGNEIFYRNGEKMMSVRLKFEGGTVIPSAPVVLFGNFTLQSFTDAARGFDIASDGRFLMKVPIPESAQERARKIFPSTLRVVLNWANELQPK